VRESDSPTARIPHLPEEMESTLWNELMSYEEERHTPYVTSVERIGIKKGQRQGMQQGMQLLIRKLLMRRFGQLPEWVDKRLESAESRDLKQWAERILDARDLQDVFSDSRVGL